jgi:hypothetical protein
MLSFLVFVHVEPRSAIPARSESAKLPPRSVSTAAPCASTPATGQTICKLVTLKTPTDPHIPFLFNHAPTLRLRRCSTGSYVSYVFSYLCRDFPSQQGSTPPLSQSSTNQTRTLFQMLGVRIQGSNSLFSFYSPCAILPSGSRYGHRHETSALLSHPMENGPGIAIS